MAIFNTLDLDYLRRVFDDFDKDNSGFLEAAECAAALTKIGSKCKMEDLDTDGDNKISFGEFSVFSQLTGKHTHPIFKGASTNTDTSGASKTERDEPTTMGSAHCVAVRLAWSTS